MLSDRYESETCAYIRFGREMLPVTHWENVIGRSRSADIRVDRKGVGRVHAILKRSDKGVWTIYDVFSRRGVWVNSVKVGPRGMNLDTGDLINLNGTTVRFQDITTAKRQKLEAQRTSAGKSVSPLGTILELSVFELFLLLQHAMTAQEEYLPSIGLAFGLLLALEWACFLSMRLMGRSGFEVETLAFYLTSLGFSVVASSAPEEMYKQALLALLAVVLFLLCGVWLRSLKRTEQMRLPVALAALVLLGLNLVFGREINGARNWIILGGFSIQPSELVKICFVLTGASTMDRIVTRRNLLGFVIYTAFVGACLVVINDFGTAAIFFVGFLAIALLRSSSYPSAFLVLVGVGMLAVIVIAAVSAIKLFPHVANRFAGYGHIWEDPFDKGFQQTRSLMCVAAGGLFGLGLGNGWMQYMAGEGASDTDLVFAYVSEEWGLLMAVMMIFALAMLGLFVVRSAKVARSSFYTIGASAAMSILMVQAILNVFGTVDFLPLTGVTFPFVSNGGSSMMSCWGLLAFLKACDTRQNASFAVKLSDKGGNQA
jgi:cell division protein FtsW (lipid II flippase)